MKLDYIPLASVPTAESLGASAKVLVVDDGEIKKTAKANVGEHPSGKLTITGTSEVNCAAYATAQVSDENLVAGNIKKDVTILGTTGSYEGGGSSDFSTAEVTITNLTNDGVVMFPCIGADYGDGMETWDTMEIVTAEPDPDGMTYSIPVFKDGSILMISGNPPYTIAVTGDITEDSGSVTVSGNGTISVS